MTHDLEKPKHHQLNNLPEIYSLYKPVLFSLAYRMVGSVADAEDIVQDAFLNLKLSPSDKINHVKSYLWKITTNLSIDLLRSARKKREVYVGTWLPEPILQPQEIDLANRAIANEELSIAFLKLLEILNPVERAVFLLREVYCYDYVEIAEIINKSQAHCRKIFSRAKQKMDGFSIEEIDKKKYKETVHEFVEAIQNNNTKKLLSILSEDITIYSDGGGKVKAALRPISGIKRVIALLMGIQGKLPADTKFVEKDINGQPGLILKTKHHSAYIAFHFHHDKLKAVYIIANPEKLKHLN